MEYIRESGRWIAETLVVQMVENGIVSVVVYGLGLISPITTFAAAEVIHHAMQGELPSP